MTGAGALHFEIKTCFGSVSVSDFAAQFNRGYSNEIAMRKLQDTRLEETGSKTSKKRGMYNMTVYPQYLSVIWDYLSSKGGHVQHFTQQGMHKKRWAQT